MTDQSVHDYQLSVSGNTKRTMVQFTQLSDLEPKERTNICGIVVFRAPIKPTKNGDLSVHCRLVDPSHFVMDNGIRVNIFFHRNLQERMEAVQAYRTIIVARDVKVDLFNGAIQVVIYKNSEPILLDIQETPPLIPPSNYHLRDNELVLARYINDWWIEQRVNNDSVSSNVNTSQIKSSTAMIGSHTKGPRPTLTYDMASLNTPYINFTGQLLNFHMINSIQVVVYLTDYTEQLAIRPHSDTLPEHDIRPVELKHEQRTLPPEAIFECGLWDEHATRFLEANPRPFDYLYLNNVTLKIDNIHGRLVGNLRGGSYGSITIPLDLQDTRVDTIRQRKQNYLKLSDNQWPSAMQDDSFVDTKSDTARTSSTLSTYVVSGQHTTCYSIPDVYMHDKTPAIFRVKARVVSYFPHQVEHFCKLICTNCNQVIPDSMLACSCGCNSNRYVYRFALLLSDSMDEPVTTTNRLLRISVIDNEATTFLSMEPTNLTSNLTQLTQLRQRMTWLIEQKELTDWCIVSFVKPSTEDSSDSKKTNDMDITTHCCYQLFNTKGRFIQ